MTTAPNGQALDMDESSTPAASARRSGRFDGIDVHAGPGGGLASRPLPTTAGRSVTSYHAQRLVDVGDVVLAVTRELDDRTGAVLALELRAFSASATDRTALAIASGDAFLGADGALAWAQLELAQPGDDADERRTVQLRRFALASSVSVDGPFPPLAEWLRTTWELELAIGSWPAIRGTTASLAAADGGPTPAWVVPWLVTAEHRVDTAASEADPARFLKVLAPAWLEPDREASDPRA